ncbi:hypothetical protein F25303_8641 [Fusarium sp. NRRL 25303]|nr:hypothetical protein F25303_8641 [Fusarium sp. NRRL 25303]
MPQKQSFLQALAADEHNQTSFLQKFVQAASPNPPGDTIEATAVIREYLSSKNIPYEFVDVNGDGKVNVISDFQGGKGPGPRVVLNGHVDVFPVGDGSGWSRDPWSGDIVDGRLHGRGVVDMKSGTASLIIAYAFLFERRHLLSGSVALCAVADEETGGKWGTKYLIEQDKHRWGGDLMLCAEPGGLETIRFAEKGTLRLTCTVKTKGALGPYLHLSKGAIRTASAFINEIIESVEALPVDLPVEMERHLEKPEVKRAIDQAMGPGTTTIIARPTVNVGTIKGGLKVNMIPETCIVELDIRMPVGMREDTILDLIDTIIPQHEPASITIKKQAAASNPFNYSVIDHPIVGHLKDNAESLRPDADAPFPIPSMGGSDYARFLKFVVSKAVVFGVTSLELDNHVAEHDLVIPLVPFVHHAVIVRLAIKSIAGVVTVGYDSPAIRELESRAKAVGITVLNEVGVNPGVYHLYAIKAIGEVHEKRERYDATSLVLSVLACISLLLAATRRLAIATELCYLFQDGKIIEISDKDLISRAVLYHGLDGYSCPAYPNRDYVQFRQAYDTNSSLLKVSIELGWGMKWPFSPGTLSDQLDKICSFHACERDLVMLQHKFVLNWKNGAKNTITSTLELFGGPSGYSVMAKSPVFNKPGIFAPYSPESCDPIQVGVEAEKTKPVQQALWTSRHGY